MSSATNECQWMQPPCPLGRSLLTADSHSNRLPWTQPPSDRRVIVDRMCRCPESSRCQIHTRLGTAVAATVAKFKLAFAIVTTTSVHRSPKSTMTLQKKRCLKSGSVSVVRVVLKDYMSAVLTSPPVGSTSLLAIAQRVRAATSCRLSFFMMFVRWVSAVRTLMPSLAAISLLL